jgi:orotidine-5'-phosphate decarboxylase
MGSRAVTGEKIFAERLTAAMRRNASLLCVGLDPDLAKVPAPLRSAGDSRQVIVEFNAIVIEATADLVCAFKPNLGFYAAYGLAGIEALVDTRQLIPREIPVILDCKVGDTGNTVAAYAQGFFDEWDFDAVTANPYLGEEGLTPLLQRGDRGVIVLARTSNPGSGDLQDRLLADDEGPRPLFLGVAARASAWAKRYPATVGLVVGATYPSQLAQVREACPDLPILLPGVGAQGGDVAAAVSAGVDACGEGLLVSSSRGILYAGGDHPDFAEHIRHAAQRLRDEINAVRGVPARNVG